MNMNKSYIELLKNIRDDSYKIGYTDGVKVGRNELVKQYEMLQNELDVSQKRAAWLQDKLTRTKENYEGQIKNLINKVNYYEGLVHRKDTYLDMKGE